MLARGQRKKCSLLKLMPVILDFMVHGFVLKWYYLQRQHRDGGPGFRCLTTQIKLQLLGMTLRS